MKNRFVNNPMANLQCASLCTHDSVGCGLKLPHHYMKSGCSPVEE